MNKSLSVCAVGLYTRNYSYHNLSDARTTTQVSQVQYTGLPTALTYGYTYDSLGNIATYSAPGKGTVAYTYDAMGQLLSAVGDETYHYTYDSAGNILTANGHTYTYGDSGWKDLLTAYDGQTITYDDIGNPLSYYNGTRWTFGWENGRSLATANNGTTSISYAYDANGLRTGKTVGNVTHNYLYASGQLLRETYGDNILDFFYDASGHPYTLKYNGTTYYYITNLQGDVMYLVDALGNTVASYDYDPYGNIISSTGTMVEINPLRYRGYYYDTELEMYYLQSRYYDPLIGRFINADTVHFSGTSDTVVCLNLFAYCVNSPCNYSDSDGNWAERYAGFKLGNVGFDVNYNPLFLSKTFCKKYAADVISMYGTWNFWYGRNYKKMSATRIAKELFAHAILYSIGVSLMYSANTEKNLNNLIISLAGGSKILRELSSIAEKKAYLQNELGFWLFDRSKIINVNNNESFGRMVVFNAIWYMGIS